MKIAFFFLTLVGISLSQTTLSCREIRDRANCTAGSNTGASRCQWLSGRNCRGEVYEFCYENVGCGDALVCARDGTSTVGVPYLFPSTCIPPRFVAVDPQTCICPRNDTTNTCNPACGECRRCVEGTCVDPYANFRKCSSSTDCPNGMRCDTTSNPCLPSCVPDCPNPTQCLINPCETPRPAGCPDDAVCVPYYCNGCGRKFFDATGNEICRPSCTETECGPRPALPTYLCPDNTTGGFTGVCKRDPTTNVCAWEIKRCPVCPDNLRLCPTLFCRYGYETETITVGDTTVRCPTCNCKPEPTCNRTIIACPAIVCSSPAAPIVENCCPTCPPRCDGVVCPQVLCVEGYEYKVLEGECCGTCVPRINCAAVQCGPTPVCGPGEILVRERCCPICRQVVNCSTVRCADPQCPAGFKPIVRDGSCCAECVPRPACDGVMCPACVGATTPVRTDLSCCPICRPIDFCTTVLCALPNCPREKWITRDGECCPQCPRCTDTDNRLCNPNDDSDCRAGHYTGSDCNVTVPPNDRVVREVIVRLCDCDTPQLDTQTIRIIAATLSNVDAKYVTVTFLGLADDNRCCKRYKITITAERTDSTVNVEAAATQVSEALSSNGWSVESTSEVSSGSVLFASAFLALLLALF